MLNKHFMIVSMLAGVSLCACGSHDSANCIAVDPAVPAETMADSLSANLSCFASAESVVEWLGSDRDFSLEYAKALTQRTAYNYGDSMGVFLQAIDTLCAQLPPVERVKTLVRICEPQRLGFMVREDKDEAMIVPMIERAYSADSSKLAAFRSTYYQTRSHKR